MSNWNDYIPEEKAKLGAGDYRCEIVNVEDTISKTSGKPMIVVTVKINGSSINVKHYLVKNEYFNGNMTELFDCFSIRRGDFNTLSWIGAVGAAKFVEDENLYLKIKWFLNPDKAAKLPEWVGKVPERQLINELPAGDDEEDPFL